MNPFNVRSAKLQCSLLRSATASTAHPTTRLANLRARHVHRCRHALVPGVSIASRGRSHSGRDWRSSRGKMAAAQSAAGFVHPGILVARPTGFDRSNDVERTEPQTTALSEAQTGKPDTGVNSGVAFSSLSWTPRQRAYVGCGVQSQPQRGVLRRNQRRHSRLHAGVVVVLHRQQGQRAKGHTDPERVVGDSEGSTNSTPRPTATAISRRRGPARCSPGQRKSSATRSPPRPAKARSTSPNSRPC